MTKENSHAYELLRRRDALRRTGQLWLGGLVIWAVVLGWVLFGFLNSFTDDLNPLLSWAITWLAPVAVLAIGTLATRARLRDIDSRLLHAEGPKG